VSFGNKAVLLSSNISFDTFNKITELPSFNTLRHKVSLLCETGRVFALKLYKTTINKRSGFVLSFPDIDKASLSASKKLIIPKSFNGYFLENTHLSEPSLIKSVDAALNKITGNLIAKRMDLT